MVYGEFGVSRIVCSECATHTKEYDIRKRPVTVEREIQTSSIVLVYSELRYIVNWDYNGLRDVVD